MTVQHVRFESGVDGAHLHIEHLPDELQAQIRDAFERLAKGVEPSEFPDPRWPQVAEHVDEAERLWSQWGTWLVGQIVDAVQSDDVPEMVDMALRRHSAAYVAAFAGVTFDPDATLSITARSSLAKAWRPTVPPDHPLTALIPTTYQLGLADDVTTPRRRGARSVPRPPVTDAERAGMDYARNRAGAYVRKPIARLHADVLASLVARGVPIDRATLTDVERERVAAAVARAIETRGGVKQLEQDLQGVVVDTAILNDLRRVARTELQTALGHGAWTVLEERFGGGGKDPLVFRIVSEHACDHCRRLYGVAPESIRYRMSEVRDWTQAGGNFQLPAAEWRAVIGPTHPMCACPNWSLDVQNRTRRNVAEDALQESARLVVARAKRAGSGR